jgi:hypothetical protein
MVLWHVLSSECSTKVLDDGVSANEVVRGVEVVCIFDVWFGVVVMKER